MTALLPSPRMGLMAQQKEERRQRIREESRRLLIELGYEGLTVRKLATACGLSVPTLYNLVGSKATIIAEDAIETFRRVSERFDEAAEGDPIDRAFALYEVVRAEILSRDAYFRALLPHLDAVPELRPVRDAVGQLQTAQLVHVLSSGPRQVFQADFDLRLAASQLYDLANAAFTGWAVGRVPQAQLGPRLRHGAALVLASGARGAAKQKLLEIVRETTAALQS